MTSPSAWLRRRPELRLAPPLPFSANPPLLDLAGTVLTGQELDRRAAFLRASDADLWTSARLLLRLSLALHLPTPAAAIGIDEGAFRRPELSEPNPRQLRFNVSHTAGLVAIAIAWGAPIGVDVEPAHRELTPDLSGRVFTPGEIAEDRDSSQPFARSFLRRWTAKEALAKATGEGLSTDWLGFSVGGLAQGGSLSVAAHTQGAAPYAHLSLHCFQTPTGHFGAVANSGLFPPRSAAPPWPWPA